MLYLKITLGKRGKVVGPFSDEVERMMAEDEIRQTASATICHNNHSLLENGLSTEEMSNEEELVTVSRTDLFFFFTNPLSVAA